MNIDPADLLELRRAVAGFGETDGAGWRNTAGIPEASEEGPLVLTQWTSLKTTSSSNGL